MNLDFFSLYSFAKMWQSLWNTEVLYQDEYDFQTNVLLSYHTFHQFFSEDQKVPKGRNIMEI